MRKRLMAVAAVGLLIAGAWLGNLFRGFGLGGSGSGVGDDGATGEVQVSLDAGADEPPQDDPAPRQETVADAPAPARAADVLTVLVDRDAYQVQSGEDASASFAPATLDEVVEQARTRAGDAHGVRVRLRYRRTSQEGARADLIEALQAGGIEREQIIETTGFVD
jgi:hypothetical protein